jgi:hypothetical protein
LAKARKEYAGFVRFPYATKQLREGTTWKINGESVTISQPPPGYGITTVFDEDMANFMKDHKGKSLVVFLNHDFQTPSDPFFDCGAYKDGGVYKFGGIEWKAETSSDPFGLSKPTGD